MRNLILFEGKAVSLVDVMGTKDVNLRYRHYSEV